MDADMGQLTIDDIVQSRDEALGALENCFNAVGDAIAQTIQTGPYLDQLTKRFQDLKNERASIRASATDEVLALPEVLAAAATLSALSSKMTTVAQALSKAASVLNVTASVLSFGQQFADAIASAQKPH
jgi:hypothetical protein